MKQAWLVNDKWDGQDDWKIVFEDPGYRYGQTIPIAYIELFGEGHNKPTEN